MPTFPADDLVALASSMFRAAGVPDEDAGIVARSLVDANLCGHDSHGVMRVPQYIEFIRKGTYKTGVPLTVMSETPAVVAADAGWGLGQVQTYRLLAKVFPKAKELGVAAGTLRNCGHIGRLGEYAEAAARHNLALLAMANSHGAGRRVAPLGGTEGRIGTNPICMGTPTSADPVVLDFGTSAVAEGKVRVNFQKKEPVPDGWLLDATGKPTSDPGVLYADPRGTILPFGGSQAYKGFGLGLLIDLLSGGMSGGACSGPSFPIAGQGNAAVFVVLNPALFGGVEHFLQQTDGLTDYVRSCPRAEGVSAITLPGDPERATKQKRLSDGVAIPDGTWELIAKTAGELGVTMLMG